MNAKVRKSKTSDLSKKSPTKAEVAASLAIAKRLDEAIPLSTPEWRRVEQMLMRLTEFAPTDLVFDVASAIAFYADDQAKRGYILGTHDSVKLVA
ncbi:MAG: hypothetical protein Q8T09_13395 [Candidatus Melainabacteria bacterium]|nr:hypothetical protein [Candidatus Melainabacteria bacterium]